MVKKFFNVFYKEINGLHEAAYLLGLFAFLSQILALFRDRILAGSFGATKILDTYYASFGIPDFIFTTVASMVSISVLVPFITEKMERSEEETRNFIKNIFSFFSVAIVGVSIVAFILMPYLAPKFFPGILDKTSLINMSRIMLLSPILLGTSNFLASITQVGKRFLVYALSPLLYNFGIIIGALFFYPVLGIYGLSLGVVLGALMHLGIQIPFVSKSGLFKPLPLSFDWNSVKNVFFISVPRTITLGMTQITTLALVGMASLVREGSISIYNFASNIQSVPLSIIGVSYSLAAFPTLSKYIAKNQNNEFISCITTALRHIIFWSIPISVLFIVLRAQIVRVIYGAGNFGWNETRITAAAIAIFALSVAAQSMVLIFVRGYYAKGNTKKALLAGVTTGVLAISFSLIFLKVFESWNFFRYFIEHLYRVDDLAGTKILMLALGFSIAQIINCLILWVMFEREYKDFSKPLFRVLFQSFSASVIMGFTAYLGLNVFVNIFNINTLIGIFMQGFLSGIIGIITFILVLKLLKSPELEEAGNTIHKKFWKVRPIVPDTNADDLL